MCVESACVKSKKASSLVLVASADNAVCGGYIDKQRLRISCTCIGVSVLSASADNHVVRVPTVSPADKLCGVEWCVSVVCG